MGQEVTKSGLEPLTLQIEEKDGEVGVAELCENLKAEPAGWRRRGGVSDDDDALDSCFSSGDRRAHGEPLGTDRCSKAPVFDVAAAEDQSGPGSDRGAHFEATERCVGVDSDCDGRVDQRTPIHG